ncbi:MAG: SusD/RagB family nutrient-binding outer membrane lipoprotein [Bacteroidota bacterium]
MKKLIYLMAFVFVFGACEEGFEEMNVDPTKPTQLSPAVKMTTIQMYSAGTSYVATLFYNMGVVMPIMQQLNCTSYRWEYTDGQDHRFFDEQYASSVKAVVDLVHGLENSDDPNAVTDLAIANVWKVLIFSRLTDTYGDIPYSEAGKAFIEGVRFPKYDTQESIYADMLSILESSANTLAAGGTSSYGNGDVVYNGDVAKWNKFANSLMLRLAMRMVKVDENAAKSWAQKAIAGGVMESNEDIAYMTFESAAGFGGIFGPTINPITRSFASRFGNQVKMSDTFINFMKDRSDPRISVLSSTTQGETDAELQIGQPNIDRTRAAANSKPNMKIFGGLVGWSWFRDEGNYDAPFFYQTYAEVELMLAEAANRWGIAPSDAETHYNNGVTAAMTYLKLYEASALTNAGEATITQDQIDAYLAENPFNGDEALKMINEQYWIASFPNGLETWANWKRSGYPDLAPVLHDHSITPNGDIPRRFTYPQTELATNPDNVQEAIDRQGDEMTTRVWWDK